MSDGKEPFLWTKQGGAFGDVTRWMKDIFGAIRGNLGIVLILAAAFGLYLVGGKIVDRFFPKKAAPVQVQTNSGHVETNSDKRSKIGLINL